MRGPIVERTRGLAEQIAIVVRRVIGVPDYETYLAHVHGRHPEAVPMTRAEFEKCRMTDKYSRPGNRCC